MVVSQVQYTDISFSSYMKKPILCFFGRNCLSLCVYHSCLGEILTLIIKSNTTTLIVCINDLFFNPMQLKVKINMQAFERHLKDIFAHSPLPKYLFLRL